MQAESHLAVLDNALRVHVAGVVQKTGSTGLVSACLTKFAANIFFQTRDINTFQYSI